MRRRRPGVARLATALGLLGLLGLLVGTGIAWARPGGGQSYGGGSSGGGGGGSGNRGGGELLFFVIRVWVQFCIAYPQFGLPATALAAILWVRYRRLHPLATKPWNTRSTAPPQRAVTRDLDDIRGLDPAFSSILFADFAYALYARAHEARAAPAALAALAPYLAEAARRQLAARQPPGTPVEGVVIGAMRVVDLALPAPVAKAAHASRAAAPAAAAAGAAASAGAPSRPQIVLTLEFEANMTAGSGAAARTQYVRERWRLVRDAAAKSRPPEAVGSFHCPHCGTPFADTGGGRCQYCGEVVTDGRFDWSAQSIDVSELEDRPPSLSTTVAEQGTDFPTIFHPALAARRAELAKDDPATTDAALAARLGLIYERLNAAWTGLDLTPARPFVSDRLAAYLEYWVQAYRAQGLRNVLEGMRMTDQKLVKVIRDRYFDALTFRLWATGRDYTVRQAGGEVVAGKPRTDRPYSEYWTLIRSARRQGAPRADAACPNCGAPLAVNMAGRCEHCGALITRGDFDWVLSTIEQDDAYTG